MIYKFICSQLSPFKAAPLRPNILVKYFQTLRIFSLGNYGNYLPTWYLEKNTDNTNFYTIFHSYFTETKKAGTNIYDYHYDVVIGKQKDGQ